jgi:hypothetical protein
MLSLLGTKSIDNHLGFQVPDLDRVVGGGAEPVSVGREDEAVDDLTSIERVQSLALVQVPQHSGVVLTTTRGQGAVRGHTDGVEVASVSDKVVSELAVGQVPDLDQTIPSSGNNQRNRLRGREAYARNPLCMSLRVATDGILALS